jgi:hypothetical protein
VGFVMSGGALCFWMTSVKRLSRLAAELGGEFRLGLDLLGPLCVDGSAGGGVVEAANTTLTTHAEEESCGVYTSVSFPSDGGSSACPTKADSIGGECRGRGDNTTLVGASQ